MAGAESVAWGERDMTKKKRRNLQPTQDEVILFKVLYDSGMTANAIAFQVGKDPKTVRKYLSYQNYFNDYIKTIVKMVEESYKAEGRWPVGTSRGRV